MCRVSDKIKFCTCVDGSYEDLPHYWLLYRFNKQKDLQCIGLPIMPTDFLQPNFQIDRQTLSIRLNEPDAFDKKIQFKAKDQLEIVINNLLDESQRMVFTFRFRKGKWVDEGCDVFELMNRYDELEFGNFQELENK
jgi:hypothetical protein